MSDRDWTKFFEFNGVEVLSVGEAQCRGTAPFSDKPGKFHWNPKTGLADEKQLGETYNPTTFLTRLHKHEQDNFPDDALERLADWRGLPPQAFLWWGFASDGENVYDAITASSENVRDRRRCALSGKNRKWMAAPGSSLDVSGWHRLAKAKPGSLVCITEGSWDGAALNWVARKAGAQVTVLSLPGASTFKAEWAARLTGYQVVLFFDNDAAGAAGEERAARILEQYGIKPRFMRWDDDWAQPYDVNDFVAWGRKRKKHPKETWLALSSRFAASPRNRTNAPTTNEDTTNSSFQESDPADCPTFDDVRKVFARHIRVCDETEMALRIILAVGLSRTLLGDPLWVYLVAASGGGKTTLLKSLGGWIHTIILSRITPKTIVSGQRGETDPSLLPKLNGKVVVWLEFTEILTMNSNDRDEIFSLCRSMFDGEVSRPYGNGLFRHYTNVNFPMLMACTPAIHGCKTALMGERCLKLCMQHTGDPLETVLAAMRGSGNEEKAAAEPRDVVGRFLSQKVDAAALPRVSEKLEIRIAALAQLIGTLRAQVDRELWGERDMKYRPTTEIGTRLAKQLVKLARMLALVEGKAEVDSDTYAIVDRVARDTATGFNLEIVKAIADAGGSATREQIRDALGLPLTSLAEKLIDLAALGVVVKRVGAGPTAKGAKRPSDLWTLSDSTKALWNKAKPWGSGLKTEVDPPKGVRGRSSLIERVGRKREKERRKSA